MCDGRPILAICSLTRSLQSTGKWVFHYGTNRQMDIATSRLNWPKGRFSENKEPFATSQLGFQTGRDHNNCTFLLLQEQLVWIYYSHLKHNKVAHSYLFKTGIYLLFGISESFIKRLSTSLVHSAAPPPLPTHSGDMQGVRWS